MVTVVLNTALPKVKWLQRANDLFGTIVRN